MARDYIDMGSTPYEEDCAQVGTDGYSARARAECTRFIEQLRRMFGPEPEGAFFRVKANPHDFGSYYSVVCNFDDENEEAIKYAYNCENNSPARWDSEVEPAPADSDEPDDYGLAIYPGSTQVVIHQDAYCDFCHKEKPVPAVVDGRTRGGRWAYMCAQHAREKGLGLGEGYGQRLIRP